MNDFLISLGSGLLVTVFLGVVLIINRLEKISADLEQVRKCVTFEDLD
jgi:hypothetical protein